MTPATEGTRHAMYYATVTVNGRTIGEFRRSIPDPLAHTTVTVSARDMLRALLRRKPLVVTVNIDADSDTATRLLELDSDYLGPRGSASRMAWGASLHSSLRDL